jgi:hypothetical protein
MDHENHENHERQQDPASCFEAWKEMAERESKADSPYKALTGLDGHIQPKMHGKVREKTIWSFWFDPEHCRSSSRCTLPASVKLCAETVRRNKGSFDFRMIFFDQVTDYVSMTELPLHWRLLSPVQMKDALMNALLARYGGVALDASVILLRPLDKLWGDFVKQKATFQGLMYRVGGKSWGLPETLAPWFMMSRRQGIASAAVRNQVSTLCSKHTDPTFKLADHMLTPSLQMFNHSLPRCRKDPMVLSIGECAEFDDSDLSDDMTGSPRNDGKLLLSDPRDSSQLSFSMLDDFGMGGWQVDDSTSFTPEMWDDMLGIEEIHGRPPCSSPKECWHQVFMPRFHSKQEPPLNFIKLFRTGGPLRFKSRKELVENQSTFFYNWLKLAGLNKTELNATAVIHII